MYVCMYVCLFVCLFVCSFVCMYVSRLVVAANAALFFCEPCRLQVHLTLGLELKQLVE